MPDSDVLVSGPLTVDEIVEVLRIQARDEQGNPKWSDNEIKLAMKLAVLNSFGKYYLTDTTTLAYTSGTFEYTLANDVERIIYITRDKTGIIDLSQNLIGSAPISPNVSGWRHLKSRESNRLVFQRDYPSCTLTIDYERNVPAPFENRKVGTAISSTTATSLTLTEASPNLARLSLPAYAKIDNEIVKITAVSGNTDCTIERGKFSSAAATHALGAEVKFLVFADSDRFYSFLFTEMGRLLNLWRVQSGSANIDVASNLTVSRLMKEDADEILRKIPQARRSRRMQFSKSRRPRRGLTT